MALKSLASALRAAAAERTASGVINALPHHGETPIMFFSSVQPGAPNRLSMRMSFPKAAIEDVGALVPVIALFAEQKRDFGGPIGIKRTVKP